MGPPWIKDREHELMKFFAFWALFNLYKDLFMTLEDCDEAVEVPLKHNKSNIEIHPLKTQQNLV